MLCQFQQETDQREGFDLSPEELVVGIVPLLLPIFSLTGWICNFFFDLPHSAPLFLLVIIPHHLVDGTNVFRSVFLEVLDVQLCDKLGKRQLPGFLLRVGQDAELLGIQPSSLAVWKCAWERWLRLYASIHRWYFSGILLFANGRVPIGFQFGEDTMPCPGAPCKHARLQVAHG
jgi:hypothetical protein